MPRSFTRRTLYQRAIKSGAMIGIVLAASCSGGSFAGSSGTPVAAPTNVAGQSDTSGISAGAALQAPAATPTPKP